MPSEYEDQLALQKQHTLMSRPESPALEGSAATAIAQAFRDLIEHRYLYQKVTVDLTLIDNPVKQAVKEATARAITPGAGSGTGKPGAFHPTPATEQRLKELRLEIEQRPWRPTTRHTGDDPDSAGIRRWARLGTQPLETRANDMNLMFYLPPIRLHCPGRCKNSSTFIALASSNDLGFDSPYPSKTSNGETEQVYIPIYRCEMCRGTIYTILIRRTGLRLHLCGVAPRRELPAPEFVPEQIVPILNDAEQAVAEGDTYAGFYHLRTMLEHYLKARMGIPIEQKIRGDELIAKHYKTLSQPAGAMLPSLTVTWEKLSEWLHTRTGEVPDYQKERTSICKHIEGLRVLGDTALAENTNESVS
jgi:hypothetical protein